MSEIFRLEYITLSIAKNVTFESHHNISRSSGSLASFPGSPGMQICIARVAWYLLRKHDVMKIGLKEKGNINSIKVLPREAAYQPASIREVLGEVRAAAAPIWVWTLSLRKLGQVYSPYGGQ